MVQLNGKFPDWEPGLPLDDAAPGATTAGTQLARLRRYWALVLACVLIAVAGAVAATERTPTTYTGRASLIVSSNDRSPDQDAVLVLGYADYFNDGAYQARLAASGILPPGTTVSAQAAADSPILLVDATAPTAQAAQSTASRVALAFRRDVNKVSDSRNRAKIEKLQRQLDEYRSLRDAGNAAPSDAAITDLQSRLLQARSDQGNNKLEELELAGGVTSSSPRLTMNLLYGVVAGLILGVMAALLLGQFSRRLFSREDIAEKVGLQTLIEIPGGGAAKAVRQRQLRLQQLANIVRAQLCGRTVIAVTEPTGGAGGKTVAWGLARSLAAHGGPCLLIRVHGSDGPPTGPAVHPGGDVVAHGSIDPDRPLAAALNRWIAPVSAKGVSVLTLRSRDDGKSGLSYEGSQHLLLWAESFSGFVVVQAPPVVESADGQLLCAVTGPTLLVVEKSVTNSADTAEAVSILEQTNAGILGAVLVGASSGADEELPFETSLDDYQRESTSTALAVRPSQALAVKTSET